MERIPLDQLSEAEKVALVELLGYRSDGTFVLTAEGQPHRDKYTGVPVTLANMLIVPGSVVILDNNEMSIAHYLEDAAAA